MKFQGIDYCELRGDKYKYTQPKLKAGDTIKLLYDDETPTVRLGDKRMKRGNYVVTKVDNGFIDNRKAYVLLKNGAKYDYLIYTIAIDKAIEAGVIVVKNSWKKLLTFSKKLVFYLHDENWIFRQGW